MSDDTPTCDETHQTDAGPLFPKWVMGQLEESLAEMSNGPLSRMASETAPTAICPECGYGADDCAHGRPPIRVSRNDERLIAYALSYYAAIRDDSIRNGLSVGEKIDAPHNTRAAQERDRAIELSRRFR